MSNNKTAPKRVGPYQVNYVRPLDSGDQGGHQVLFPDGRILRVAPDDQTSALRRYRTILAGLTAICEQVGGESAADELAEGGIDPIMDPVAYLTGWLALNRVSNCQIIMPIEDTEITITTTRDQLRKALNRIDLGMAGSGDGVDAFLKIVDH